MMIMMMMMMMMMKMVLVLVMVIVIMVMLVMVLVLLLLMHCGIESNLHAVHAGNAGIQAEESATGSKKGSSITLSSSKRRHACRKSSSMCPPGSHCGAPCNSESRGTPGRWAPCSRSAEPPACSPLPASGPGPPRQLAGLRRRPVPPRCLPCPRGSPRAPRGAGAPPARAGRAREGLRRRG